MFSRKCWREDPKERVTFRIVCDMLPSNLGTGDKTMISSEPSDLEKIGVGVKKLSIKQNMNRIK